MGFFEWRDEYRVGVKLVDQQHRKLVSLVDELHEAMKSGKGSEGARRVLRGLVDYTKTHFQTEEDYMKTHSYPNFQSHKKAHEDLAKQAEELLLQVENGKLTVPIETSKFLKDWLDTHILVTDKKMGNFLVGKGLT